MGEFTNPFKNAPFVCEYKVHGYKHQPHMIEVGFLLVDDRDNRDRYVIYSPQVEVMNAMISWCTESFGAPSIFEQWSVMRNTFSFHNYGDSLLFVLRWKGIM